MFFINFLLVLLAQLENTFDYIDSQIKSCIKSTLTHFLSQITYIDRAFKKADLFINYSQENQNKARLSAKHWLRWTNCYLIFWTIINDSWEARRVIYFSKNAVRSYRNAYIEFIIHSYVMKIHLYIAIKKSLIYLCSKQINVLIFGARRMEFLMNAHVFSSLRFLTKIVCLYVRNWTLDVSRTINLRLVTCAHFVELFGMDFYQNYSVLFPIRFFIVSSRENVIIPFRKVLW